MNLYIKPYPKNVFPTDYIKKLRVITYYNKFKSSNQIISNNSTFSSKPLDRTTIVYESTCPLGD